MATFALNAQTPFLLFPATGEQTTVANLDPTNTIYVGSELGLMQAQSILASFPSALTNPDVDTISPGEYVVYDGSEAKYGLANFGQPAVRVTSGAIGNFLVSRTVNNATISITQPANPQDGDLWFQINNSGVLLGVFQWSGSAWTPYQWGTTSIAAGSITAALIAAGTVVAGIVNGTTITGAIWDGVDFIFNSNGLFIYYGTPALGNLLLTVTPAAGTDGFGNVYRQGLTTYSSTTQSAVAQLLADTLNYQDDVGSMYTLGVTGQIFPAPAPLGLTLATGTNLGQNPNIAVLSASEPGASGAPAKWHTISLTAGWSVGTDANGTLYPPQYKIDALGGFLLQGCLVTPSSGTVLGVAWNSVAIPSGYCPASGSNLPTATVTQANGGHTGTVELHPNGNLELQGSFTTGNNVRLDSRIQIA